MTVWTCAPYLIESEVCFLGAIEIRPQERKRIWVRLGYFSFKCTSGGSVGEGLLAKTVLVIYRMFLLKSLSTSEDYENCKSRLLRIKAAISATEDGSVLYVNG